MLLQEIIQSLPALIANVPFLPNLVKPILVKALQTALRQIKAEEIERMAQLFETWMDAIGKRDYATIAAMYEAADVEPGGILERFTARITGLDTRGVHIDDSNLLDGQSNHIQSEIHSVDIERVVNEYRSNGYGNSD